MSQDIFPPFITLIIIMLLLSVLASELKRDICTLYILFNLIILPQVPLIKFSSDNISNEVNFNTDHHACISQFICIYVTGFKNLIFIVILASWKAGLVHQTWLTQSDLLHFLILSCHFLLE